MAGERGEDSTLGPGVDRADRVDNEGDATVSLKESLDRGGDAVIGGHAVNHKERTAGRVQAISSSARG